MEWFVVVHESHLSNSAGDTRTDYGIASMLHSTYDKAENTLAYCKAMQEDGKRGTEGRYFIARVTEEETDDAN